MKKSYQLISLVIVLKIQIQLFHCIIQRSKPHHIKKIKLLPDIT
ncbi:hypothetical protein pb186bvf_015923 [Paramecium bursaria]